MPAYPFHGYRNHTGAVDIGVTADQVRLFAHQIDAQVEGVNQDARVAASDPAVTWDLRLGTAWLAWYSAWKDELAVADSNDWLTFGLGTEYERLRDWQVQARDWQKRIAQASGKKSSMPDIQVAGGETSALTYAVYGAVGGALLLLLLRR